MQEYHYSARLYDPLLSHWIHPIRSRISAIVKRNEYHHILDVCCGTGAQLKILKEEGFEGKGIDLSDAMLEVAGRGPVVADCIQGDATDMLFRDQSFDLVSITFALHEKNRQSAQKIIEEMLRLTMVGGDIIIVDYDLSDRSSKLYKTLIYLIERIAGGEHYRNFIAYMKYGGLPTLLAEADLKELHRYYFGGKSVVLLHLRKMAQRDQ